MYDLICPKSTLGRRATKLILSHHPGISQCQSDIQRRSPGTVAILIALASNRCPHIRQRSLCTPRSSLGHHTRCFSRNNIPLSHIDMGTARLPPRCAHGICHANRGHDGEAGSACRSSGSHISPVPCGMGRVLGCELFSAVFDAADVNSSGTTD